MNLLIPMAGSGKRFIDAGYTKPKPLIDLFQTTMIEHVLDNITSHVVCENYIFIVQQEHCEKYGLDKVLIAKTNDNCKIIKINQVTEGAACTALLAKEYIDNKVPLMIANCDQISFFDKTQFSMKTSVSDGIIFIFKDNGPNNSYVKIDDYGEISEVVEKKVISQYATTGMYYWKQGCDFVHYAEDMIGANDRTNNEFYIAPSYNYMIEDMNRIVPLMVDRHYPIGTPGDLIRYVSL